MMMVVMSARQVHMRLSLIQLVLDFVKHIVGAQTHTDSLIEMSAYEMVNRVDKAYAHTITLRADKQRHCFKLMMNQHVIHQIFKGHILVLGIISGGGAGCLLWGAQMRLIVAIDVPRANRTRINHVRAELVLPQQFVVNILDRLERDAQIHVVHGCGLDNHDPAAAVHVGRLLQLLMLL